MQAPRTWQLANASINRLLYSPEGFVLVGWNDAMHLDTAAPEETDGEPGHADPRERTA